VAVAAAVLRAGLYKQEIEEIFSEMQELPK